MMDLQIGRKCYEKTQILQIHTSITQTALGTRCSSGTIQMQNNQGPMDSCSVSTVCLLKAHSSIQKLQMTLIRIASSQTTQQNLGLPSNLGHLYKIQYLIINHWKEMQLLQENKDQHCLTKIPSKCRHISSHGSNQGMFLSLFTQFLLCMPTEIESLRLSQNILEW